MKLLLLVVVSAPFLSACVSAPAPSARAPAPPTPSCQAGGRGARECSLSLSESRVCQVSCPDGQFACCSDDQGRAHCRCLPASDFEPHATISHAPQEATAP